MNLHFINVLDVIERAKQSIVANSDNESYASMLGDLVEKFKRQLSEDLGLSEELLFPIDPAAEKHPDVEKLYQEGFMLSSEAEKLYWEVDSSI